MIFLHHPALALCLSMIFFRKPVPTFRDHALMAHFSCSKGNPADAPPGSRPLHEREQSCKQLSGPGRAPTDAQIDGNDTLDRADHSVAAGKDAAVDGAIA